MQLRPKVLLPLLVLGAGLVATTALVVARPAPDAQQHDARTPVVRVLQVQPGTARMVVRAQGTVEPRTESDLVSEVSGRLIWLSPALDAGAAFAPGEVLARIEPRDYQSSLERARAAVQRAESQLELARATLERRRSLGAAGASSRSALDEARNAERIAAADLRDARAAAVQAKLDLERTELRAPFAGRVRERTVDMGQFLNRGVEVARLYAVDAAEVRLPVASAELAFLDLPDPSRSAAARARRMGEAPQPGPDEAPTDSVPEMAGVRLSAVFAGRERAWQGRLIRAEGALDPRTRMLTLVARIDADAQEGLPVGLFVDAEIQGREFEGVIALPRGALRPGDQVAVVDDESRLRLRDVEVLRADGETLWVRAGVEPGERICSEPPAVVVDGMLVRVEQAEAAGAEGVGGAHS
jgi:RND family efflux transporter MFP subunit